MTDMTSRAPDATSGHSRQKAGRERRRASARSGAVTGRRASVYPAVFAATALMSREAFHGANGTTAVAGNKTANGASGRKTPLDWRHLIRAMPSLFFLSLIAAALFYYANLAQPIQLATVTPQQSTLASISNLNMQPAGQVRNGQVQLLISGLISDPTASQLILFTRSPASAHWQPQAACCGISGQELGGTAVLGSPESPLTGTQVMAFRLISTGGTIEAQGTITVTIDSYPNGRKLVLDVVDVLSVLAILVTLWQYLLTPPNPRRSTREKAGIPHAAPAARHPEEEHGH